MRTSRFATLLFSVALVSSGCVRRAASPLEALEDADKAAQGSGASARELSLAGYHAYLVSSDPKQAQARFDQALVSNPSEPYGLYGQLLMARRSGHPEKALEAALTVCEQAATHPLSVAAARYVLDIAGASVDLDGLILQRAEAALAAGVTGDAAHLLRSAGATIHAQRGDEAAQGRVLTSMGTPDRYTLLGPFFAHQVLSFDELTGPEQDGSVAGPYTGPFGKLVPRAVAFPDGRFSLAGEGSQGDGYVFAVDLDVSESATYVVRSVTSAAHKVYLDGTLLFARRSFERSESSVSARGVELDAGKHRLLVRLSKDDRTGTVSLGVMRADGKPSSIKFAAAQGAAPRWTGAAVADLSHVYPDAKDFADALEAEAGPALAQYLAVRDAMGRDRDGAKRLLAALSSSLKGPAITSLRADLALGDRTVPSKVARGRATRDLEATLEKDRGDVGALLASATLALEDGRHIEATELVKQARAASASVGWQVPMLQARVELGLGVDAQAEQSALEALKIQPGLCEALSLRYDVARRRDAVALSDQLLGSLQKCPGALGRRAEHSKARGDLPAAASAFEKLLKRDVGNVPAALQLTALYVSQRRFDDAVKLLTQLRTVWPRNATLLKSIADVHEFAGRPKDALAAREHALIIDGGDLQLRRIVERAKTGKELLADHAIDGKAAIAAYQAQPGTEDAASIYILDAATVQVFADGSSVDRIHIVQKAVDQSGVSDVGEVNLPAGVYVLALRTLKADGTVLEPESIEGKDTISLPGVQVGDYVEYEYLQANAARGKAQPGFTASSFYFQISRQPNHWSTYKVIAPKGTGLTVDAHNLAPMQVRTEGDSEVFFYEQRHVPPYIPEPNGPPSGNEYLPFVTVGAGATGNDGVVGAYADAFLDRGQITSEVEAFAKSAAGESTGVDAVKAIYAAVMQKLQGRDAGLGGSAAASLAQDRGSRLWSLKASLEAVGIPARIAAVRTFSTDPAPYRFPTEALLPYLCVRVELPGSGGEIWLDPLVRFAPFGELPEQAMGGREAFLLPEPGRPLAKVKTPPKVARAGKDVKLDLTLSADGKLTGKGEEVYTGFEAAQLAEALDALSPDQRNQALESALARYFGGAQLSKLSLDVKREVGAPLTVRYSFTAPRFGRLEGDKKMVLGSLTFPSFLGRRYVQLGSRRTLLYIDGTEASRIRATVELPAGFNLNSPLAEVKASGNFGHFVRREKQDGNKLSVEEEYRLDAARIPVARYDDFAQFAGEVDLIQGRDLLLEKK